MTIRERKGSLEGLQVCYIGDGNNMANSIIVGCLKMGMQVAVACPDAYLAGSAGAGVCKAYPGFRLTDSPKEAAKGADVIFTDVWASMGQEDEAEERKKAFAGYQINEEIMALVKPGCYGSALPACSPRRGNHCRSV